MVAGEVLLGSLWRRSSLISSPLCSPYSSYSLYSLMSTAMDHCFFKKAVFSLSLHVNAFLHYFCHSEILLPFLILIPNWISHAYISWTQSTGSCLQSNPFMKLGDWGYIRVMCKEPDESAKATSWPKRPKRQTFSLFTLKRSPGVFQLKHGQQHLQTSLL